MTFETNIASVQEEGVHVVETKAVTPQDELHYATRTESCSKNLKTEFHPEVHGHFRF